MFSENYSILENHLKKGNKFTYNRTNVFLPFTTNKNQRVTFENGVLPIIGALSRLICGKKVRGIGDVNISENILGNENFDVDSSDEFYANLLVDEYLGEDKLNILHPKLFLYLPLSDGPEASGEIKIAHFLKNEFFSGIDIENFFYEGNYKYNSNILIEFIVDNLKELPDGEEFSESCIPKPLSKVIEVFKEDMEFLLLNHKDFLVKNFDGILSFYMFFYFVQFTLKSASNIVSDELEKTFYLLDWETVSKNRSCVKLGYRRVDNYLKTLLIKIDAMEHLNILLGTNGLLPSEIIEQVNNLNQSDKSEFVACFKSWIQYVRAQESLEEIKLPDDFEELFIIYLKSIEDSYQLNTSRHGTVSRYPIIIDDLGRKYFLKRRGRFGYMFNLSQEILILITALCIKDEKIKITQLFEEYERRGLFFDRDSWEIIVELFNKLNLIDKKSDSGDIQYVKSIL